MPDHFAVDEIPLRELGWLSDFGKGRRYRRRGDLVLIAGDDRRLSRQADGDFPGGVNFSQRRLAGLVDRRS